jgi:hypothetical protein
VDLIPADVQVQVCSTTGTQAYSFQCPGCRVLVNKAANEQIVAALSRVGVRIVNWSLPAELAEPKVGPPITHDDLLSFHLALTGDRWHEELAGLGRAS